MGPHQARDVHLPGTPQLVRLPRVSTRSRSRARPPPLRSIRPARPGVSSCSSIARRKSLTARDNSSLRAGASPSQNGIVGGAPFASATRTVPDVTWRIRQDALPSWMMSPAFDSMAKSSFSVPMKVSCGSRMTRKSAISGMAPPDVCASRRLPRRPRNSALTSSRCSSAARRPRRVEKPSADISSTASKSARDSARYGHAPRTTSYMSSSRYSAHAVSATICCARTSSGASCVTMASSSPRRTERSSAAHSIRSSRDVGKTRPFGSPPMVCPERPTRCRSVAMRFGDPIWQTRSTCPMSMPSSREAVATSARS